MTKPLTLLPRPLLGALVLFICCYAFQFDFVLADFWYQQSHQFGWKQHFWLETVLHQGVRRGHLLLLLTLLAGYGWLRWGKRGEGPQVQHFTRALEMLLLSVISCLALVALLKQLIPMDCPWDLRRYGGEHAFIGLFSPWPVARSTNACFPAGHASIGYAWLGLYFFCQQLYPRYARKALALSLSCGVLLGAAQQLRGAHFISHDIATAALCWTLSCLIAQSYQTQLDPKPATQSAAVAEQDDVAREDVASTADLADLKPSAKV